MNGMGINVRPLVVSYGWTNTALAPLVGHDEPYVSRLLRGVTTVMPEVAKKFERVTGIPRLAAYMLGIDPLPDLSVVPLDHKKAS